MKEHNPQAYERLHKYSRKTWESVLGEGYTRDDVIAHSWEISELEDARHHDENTYPELREKKRRLLDEAKRAWEKHHGHPWDGSGTLVMAWPPDD